MFCQYKEIFGTVGEGVHRYRIFNIAIVDVLVTMLVAFFIYMLCPRSNLFIILLVLFITGIIAHRLFCVRTTIDKLLFKQR